MKVLWLALGILIGYTISNQAQADEFAGTYLTVGVGNNTNFTGASIPWHDADATGAYFNLAYIGDKKSYLLNGRPVVQWMHLSQIESGPPFNEDRESSVDHLGLAVTWRLF